MSTTSLQPVGQERPEQASPPAKRQTRRQKNGNESAEAGYRFFLAKPGGSAETPVFGREFSKEGEAMVEALKSGITRSEEHTSELQSHLNLVCRLLLEK